MKRTLNTTINLSQIEKNDEYYTDTAGNVVAAYTYDAFGKTISDTGTMAGIFRYRFQCREWSSATGLVNFRARWYDPVTGRWLSKDPIGLNGGLNLYAFCEGDPVEMSGLISVGEFMVH